MSQHSRQELLATVTPRYHTAKGKEQERILDEFVASTGYHRKYAIALLNHPRKKAGDRLKRGRTAHYTPAVQRALILCWHATNGICSKRLVPYLASIGCRVRAPW